ncbi:MAG: hypothetical protein LQ346_000909 [Caloplaca aetnensis]|nr:MAG: hypothetical protein LQ346_000909 [Caloplaca aetnensis]
MFEEAQRHLDASKDDVAVILINTNAYRVAFWILAHVYRLEDLFSVIESETASSLAGNGSIDVPHLMENSPRLESVWLELLRLTSAASAIRTTTERTIIGGEILRAGHKVLSPFRQIHMDEAVFGDAPSTFDPNRFLRNKALATHPSYKPFGGGVTKCTARFTARQEVFVFVTLILHRFESRLFDEKQPLPELELGIPSSGIIDPKRKDEARVVLGRNMM